MKYILNAQQMKEADGRMIHEMGVPSLVLMERAALQCVSTMKEELTDFSSVLVVCGSGNNGGDGFAIARMLYEEQIPVDVVFVGRMESRSEETKTQMQILENLGLTIGNELPEKEYRVIIDAIFGIGLCRKIEGRYKEVIERMNRYQGYKVAVDIASGISADTGEMLGCAFKADLTVTFAYAKAGQLFHPGYEYTGKLAVRPIGIWNPAFDTEKEIYYMLEPADLKEYMPKRTANSNKGTYGKVLVIAGSKGMSGAAYLAAKAAYIAGAGLVRIYTEESNRQILQMLLPEAILTTYQEKTEEPLEELQNAMEWADVICIGCGLGRSDLSVKLMKTFLKKNQRPCVMDADGLNILSTLPEYYEYLDERYILTPHMKEMSRLTGNTVQELKEHRAEILKKFVEKYQVNVALKDSRTLVAGPKMPVFFNTSGNAAMAKAGAGDALAGLITGILAQGTNSYVAGVLGVFLHGMGGDEARDMYGKYSVMAQDIITGAGNVLKRIEEW